MKNIIEKIASRLFKRREASLESRSEAADRSCDGAYARNFEGHYDLWRDKRVTKIISHYGPLFFKNKKVLELGAGYGHIGNYLSALARMLHVWTQGLSILK